MEKVTITIGSHERTKHLADAVKSIKKTTYKNYELIVVDSAKKPLNKQIQKLCTKYIHNPRAKALSKKRNIAIKHAKGEIIAFTDDDCEIHKDWINEIINSFKLNPNILCVVGNTLPAKNYSSSAYEKQFSFTKKPIPRIIKKSLKPINFLKFGHGNNMAFKTKTFKMFGLFDENLGVGSQGMTGEDTDMFYRIYKNNYLIYYNPKAIIYHKHLVKDDDLPKNAHRNGIGGYSLLKKYFPDPRYTLFYSAVIINLILKTIKSKNKIPRQALKGWLGLR